ncbi:hypothetical protein BDZ91DRAFT_846430 [Kalaharituber pfeilii]|nr:hypothetical protein BDZ91DRAFT_846430 [Kalaharituber pfeilii]
MPRGSAVSSSSKRQNPHHQSVHSNTNGGLVSAVKRPSRSRSSSNTVASSASSQHAQSHEPSPLGQHAHHHSQNLQHQLRQLHRSSSDASSISSADCGTDWNVKANETLYSEVLGEEAIGYPNGLNGLAGGAEHRKIDINPSSEKSRTPGGSTVLPSFPLLDSITLLIIFLQLPSTVLTIIHFLFATMTFVPQSTTLLSASTATSLPSFTTLLLQGSGGSPSILTVMVADIMVAIISIFLWPSARGLLIDFAQAVMAISLGAGNTGQTGGTLKNAAVCAGVISGAKVIRNRYEFGDSWSTGPHPARELHSGSPIVGFPGLSSSSASWVRNALAVHIVAQGAMRALRGWLIQRPASASSSDTSPSNIAPASAAKESSSITGKQKDKDPESGTVALAPSTLLPAGQGIDSRRKKKQNSLVRSRQPLWAAIASTVVHIAKEVEQSQAVSEAVNLEDDAASGSPEHKAHGLGGHIWITNIGSTEVSFGAGNFPCTGVEDSGTCPYGDVSHNATAVVASGKSVFVPFFVRVNGIAWPQADIYRSEKDEDVENADVERRDEVWLIDITGLTPATEYDFEFVKTKGGVPFYQTSACTLPAQVPSSVAVPAPPPSSRPLSPVTTLLNTLSQATTTLAEQKLRLKRMKKENNRRLASIRSEIDTLKSRLGGGDKGEERARRRVLSLREFVRRAEEEIEKMTVELTRLESVPDAVEKEWKQKKRLWMDERKRLLAVENKVEQAKAAADRQASAAETEAASLAAKQEKLSTRLAKLRPEMEKLKAENSAAQDEKARKQSEREALVKHRAAMDLEFSEAISKMEKKMQEFRMQSSENWGVVATLENAAVQQAVSGFAPSTSESGIHGARSSIGPIGPSTPIMAASNPASVSTPPGFGPVIPNPLAANYVSPRRERSSSMFTSDSGAPSFSDILPGDRPLLPSLNSFGSYGNGAFESGGLKRTNSQNTRNFYGGLGRTNAVPGYEKSGDVGGELNKGNGVAGKLVGFGEQH